jgi:molybdopterin-guanine dinucleotide biosynthesis protein MobB
MKDKLRAEGPAMISFIGASGSGKTTLLVKLIAELSRRGLCVGAVKHSRRDFTLDIEGKDSDRFRKAGAGTVLLVSPRSIGLVADAPRGFFPERAAAAFFPGADIVLVEGWKGAGLPKVIVTGPASRSPRARGVIAAVGEKGSGCRVPCFSLGDIRGLADFILGFSRLT